MDCIFCKIIAGEIPCFKVYEDDKFLAFLDITPVNPGHTLVITKEHHDNFSDLPEDLAAEAIKVIKKIAPAVISGVEAEGFNLNLNNGAASGQAVEHVHWHIVPRFTGDGRNLWHGAPYEEGVAERVLEKIKNNL